MKPYEIILSYFREFVQKNSNPYSNLKNFFNQEKELFYASKVKEFQNSGISKNDAITKTRQSWVSVIRRSLESIIQELIKDFCELQK